jgi:membrane dipeptidase
MIASVSDRARRFHRDHPICDMLGINLTHPRFLIDHIDLGVRQDTTYRGDFVKLREWGVQVVMCKGGPALYDANFESVWPDMPERRPGRENPEPLYLSSSFKSPTQAVLAVLDRFLCDVEAHPDKVRLVREWTDIETARVEGKVAVLMGANRSDWFGDSPGVIRMFARLGLRMITLGGSGRDLGWDNYGEVRSGGRLTALGVRMIREMNRQGILIDLAHTNDVCALDIIDVSEQPVVDSHSNPRARMDGLRNTPDEVMKAMAAAGGLLGIMPPISGPPGEKPLERIPDEEMERTVGLIRYAVDVMGIDHVGIGTHFKTTLMPWLTDGLLRAGFSDEEAARIMGGNYLRVLRRVLPG